jgi:hypothetical protein
VEPVPSIRTRGCVMKKQLARSFCKAFTCRQSLAGNSRSRSACPAGGLFKLWHLSMAVLLATIFLGFSEPVRGQAVNATLLGTVTDSSGAPVSNAKITITETNTGIGRTTQTNESGNYVVPDLPPGTYTITAELSGFKRASRPAMTWVRPAAPLWPSSQGGKNGSERAERLGEEAENGREHQA